MRDPMLPVFRSLAVGLLVLQSGLPVYGQATQSPAMAGEAQAAHADSAPAPQLHEHEAPTQMARDQRLLLVLNRFTYGPRPGDLDHLRTVGLNAWFHAQLVPNTIDDSALEARLANYPAMQLPLAKLMELYPTNQTIRASMNGNASPPSGAAAHAIYADQKEQYKQKRERKKDPNAPKQEEAVSLPKTPDEILAMPPDKRFKELCRLNLPQLRGLRKSLTSDQRDQLTAGMTPEQIEAIAAFNGPSGVVRAEDVQVKLLRDIYSERQLQEIMVDFWLNHFNVYMGKSEDAPYYIAAYERNAIRPYALGRFEDLLLATATSPAMLNYLDNSSSVGPHSSYALGIGRGQRPKDAGLNENYAREVMELHSIGVNGGYSQHDVTELAKVFTGWTVGKGFRQDVPAQAQYDPSKHEPGDKMVLGHRIKFGDQKEGIEVLRMLAATPQCARFISTKLAVRFVSDTPPQAMVTRMSQTFLETHGDIRQVLLTMVNSPEFFTANTYRAKLKTPQEFVLSAVRATGAKVESTAAIQTAIATLGMPVYGMLTPNGYSMKAEAWSSTTQLVSRMNFAMALATNRVAGLQSDPAALLKEDGNTLDPASLSPAQKTQLLEAVLLHDPASPRTQSLITAQVAAPTRQQTAELQQIASIQNQGDPLKVHDPNLPKAPKTVTDPQSALAVGLILGSPEFQRK
jgi:uncharacterized protein (DUF1800 family)